MLGIDNNTVLMLHAEDFKDSSYSPKTVTNNGVTISSGKFDNAFVFNGTSSYLEINNIDLQSLLSSNFTIEFFVNMTSRNKSYPTPLSIASAAATANRSVWIHFNSSSTEFNFGNGTSSSVKITTSAINLNQWYHIAIVKDENLFKVFMDGNLINSATVNNFYSPSSSNFYFGTLYSTDTSTLFNGLIDEVRVSNVARWNSNFTPPTTQYEGEPTINIISKTRETIEFSVEHSSINKVDVLVNDMQKQSYSSNFDNLTFLIDKQDKTYIKGQNIIKIRVTYNNSYTCVKEIIHSIHITDEASLSEVMDEFEKISLMDLTNIDIVVKNELPREVKNGQIVVISNNYNNITMGYDYPSSPVANDIFIRIVDKNQCKFEVGINKKIDVYVFGAWKYNGSTWVRINSYIGLNNEWFPMNKEILFESGNGLSYEKYFSVRKSWENGNNRDGGQYLFTNDYIYLKDDLSFMYTSNNSHIKSKSIDFKDINYVYVDYEVEDRWNATQYIMAGTVKYSITDRTVKRNTLMLDMRNYNDLSNITFYMGYTSGESAYTDIKIYNIWCE